MVTRSWAHLPIFGSNNPLRSEFKQLWNRLYIPVCMFWAGMAEIGCELNHLARRVFAGAIPIDDRSRGEAVAQIVDAWPATVAAVSLSVSQPDPLARLSEVVSSRAISEPFSIAIHKERLRLVPEQPVAFGDITAQLRRHTLGERNEPFLSEL